MNIAISPEKSNAGLIVWSTDLWVLRSREGESLSPTVTLHIPASWNVLEPETMTFLVLPSILIIFKAVTKVWQFSGGSQKFNHPTCPCSNEVSIIVSANVS